MNSSKDDCRGRGVSAARLSFSCLLFMLSVYPGRADSWQQRAPVPGARAAHSAVWTGREMIVWGGGVDGSFLNTGGRYVPSTDTWRETSPYGAPSPRWFHAAVWTGSEMIVWGGRASFSPDNHSPDGARYNPATDTWTRMSAEGAPTPRSQFAAVWTGTELIVWGGETDGGVELNDGGRYDPETDTWSPISGESGLEPRLEPTGIWTGEEMIVFGGMKFTGGELSFGNGGRYNPVSNTWRPLPSEGAPRSRTGHTTLWTGERMIVWGGRDVPAHEDLNDGSIYTPGSDTWAPIPFSYDRPEARFYHLAAWTGSEMIIWGGHLASGTLLDTGARYNLATGVWVPMTEANAPGKRMFWRPDLGVWTGIGMLVCGGSDYPTSLDSTYLYALADPPCPPVIREQPQSLSVAVGSPATFSVGASDCATDEHPSSTQASDGPYPHHFEFETGASVGQLQIDYDFFNIPDSLRVYYEGYLIFDSDLSGQGTIRVPFGPGSARSVNIVVNEDGGPGSTAWEYGVSFRSSPLRYQWRKDGTPLVGKTNATLHFSSVSLADAGDYSVIVANTRGAVMSDVARLTVLSGPHSTNCVAAPSGLVSWWAAEGNVNDRIGSNQGALSGGVTYAPGRVGSGFLFPTGSIGVVKFAASPSLDVGSGAGFTVEGWIRLAHANPEQPIAEWNDGTRWGSHFWVHGGVLYANLTGPGGEWHRIVSNAGVPAGIFHHVALTYDKQSGRARIYLNGAVVADEGIGSFTPETAFDFYLGRRPLDGNNHTFSGVIDEFSLYGRALSAGEISAIHLAAGAGKCSTSSPCAPSGLVAWWRGDGDAKDVTGAHDGTLLFGTTFSPGVSGQAFSFDLSHARVSFADDEAFKLTDSLSFEGWINVASYAPGLIFIRGDNRGGLDPYQMSIQPSGQLHWGINTADNDFVALYSPGAMPLGVWTHVAAVLDGATGNMGMYVNGVLVNQTNTTLRPLRDLDPNSEPTVGIGNHGGTFHHFPYHGLVDEWALYSRALSATEVQGIFNAGAAGKCSTNVPPPTNCVAVPSGLVAWWRGDGDATDVTGAHDAELLFGTTFSPGVSGQAFTFDLSRARVSIPDNDAFKLTNSLSFEGWINVASYSPGLIFIRGDNQGGLDPYHMSIQPSGQIHWGINTAENDFAAVDSPEPVPTGVWLHVAAVLDGATGDLGLYLNGVLVSQTNTTLRPLRDLNPNSEPTLGIGNHGGTFHHFPFHGSVDEWALYARALSGAEIQSIFNAGAAGKCADAPSQVNLVFNGSFELGTVPPGTIDGLNSTAIVGWTVQDIDYYESPWVAGDGLRSLDMNGWIPGRISQEVSGFVVGQTYRLTFLMAGNPYFIPPLPAIKRLRATIGTASREYSFDATGRSESDLGWISQTLDFTATSPVMGLSFASLTDSAGGAALDKVSITLLTNAPPTPTNCVSLPSGLVAWWRGDGDAEDATSAHDGELLFGTTFSPGVSGQAFTFDLSRARVSIPDSDAFKLTNSLSFEGWINVASYAPGIIFIRGDNRGGLDPYHMSIQPSGQLYWGIHTEDNNVAGLLSPGVMSTGVWTHVAAVLDGATGNMGLYVNGSLVNQTNTSLRPLRDLDPNWEPAIGIGNAGGTFHHFPYHGSVDEWALYSRALSTAEIQGIYNAGAAGKCSDTNLPPQRVFDLSSDFSLAANPNGPWSYGHRTNRLAGALQLLNTSRTFGAENGVPIDIWQWNNAKPWVAKVIGPETAVSTHFNAPAGTIYFGPDPERSPEDFAVIRFTVPPGAGGTYQLETTVRSLYDSTRSVDADFHVVKNGIELFGRLVPPNSGTSFSNTLSLAAGDRIDFVAGRGTNGLADTGLKIQTTLVRLTNVPPPPSVVYDVSSDFSARSNSEGPWNYGWKSGTIGAFSNFNFSTTATYENGVSVQIWGLAPSQYPVVYHNGTTNIGLGNGGQEVSPPGTVIFTAGHDGQPQNFGVIRFTVPHQAGGQYRLESAVRTYLDGDRCGDTDYHVVVNDVEVFNEFLAPRTGTAYTNAFNLAEGDTIDFMVGRGADGVLFGSGLKIHAALKSMPLGLMSIDAVSVLGVGSIRVTGHAPPGTICQLQRSTNLIDWEDAGSVVPTTSGVFEFIDSQPANGPACFYRLRGSDR